MKLDGGIAGVRIEGEGAGAAGNRVADGAGQRDRARPPHRVGQVAEAFAEIERRRVSGERVGADARRAAAAPFDREPDRHDEFVHRILVEPGLERRIEVLESAGANPGRSTGRKEMRPGRPRRDREGFGYALRIFAGKIELLDRRLVAALRHRDGRHRKLVVDAGIVDRERCGKEPVAGDFMGCRRSGKRGQHKRKRRHGRGAGKTNRHGFAPRSSTQVWT